MTIWVDVWRKRYDYPAQGTGTDGFRLRVALPGRVGESIDSFNRTIAELVHHPNRKKRFPFKQESPNSTNYIEFGNG